MLQSFKVSDVSVCRFDFSPNLSRRVQSKKSVQWLFFNSKDIAKIFNKVIPVNLKSIYKNYIRNTQRMNADILWG